MNVGPCMCRHGTAMYVWMGLRCLLLVRLFCGQFSLLESRVLLTSFRIEFCQPSFSVGVFSLVYFCWRKDNNCLIHQCFVVQQSFQYTHTHKRCIWWEEKSPFSYDPQKSVTAFKLPRKWSENFCIIFQVDCSCCRLKEWPCVCWV